jgi:hypothetical protein
MSSRAEDIAAEMTAPDEDTLRVSACCHASVVMVNAGSDVATECDDCGRKMPQREAVPIAEL